MFSFPLTSFHLDTPLPVIFLGGHLRSNQQNDNNNIINLLI